MENKNTKKTCLPSTTRSWTPERLSVPLMSHIASFLDGLSHQEGFARLAKWTLAISKRPTSWPDQVELAYHHDVQNLCSRGCLAVQKLSFSSRQAEEKKLARNLVISGESAFDRMISEVVQLENLIRAKDTSRRLQAKQALQAWNKSLTSIDFTQTRMASVYPARVWLDLLNTCSQLKELIDKPPRVSCAKLTRWCVDKCPTLTSLQGRFRLKDMNQLHRLPLLTKLVIVLDDPAEHKTWDCNIFGRLRSLELWGVEDLRLENVFTLQHFPALVELTLSGRYDYDVEASEHNCLLGLIQQDLLDQLQMLVLDLIHDMDRVEWSELPFQSKSLFYAAIPMEVLLSEALCLEKLRQDAPRLQILYCTWSGIESGPLEEKHISFVKDYDLSREPGLAVFEHQVQLDRHVRSDLSPTAVRRPPALILDCDGEKDWPGWRRELEKAWTTGQSEDTTSVHVVVDLENYVLIECGPSKKIVDTRMEEHKERGSTRVAVLEKLVVPESQRRKGMATQIVQHVEQRVNQELKRKLVIGPVTDTSGAMARILHHRNYRLVVQGYYLQP